MNKVEMPKINKLRILKGLIEGKRDGNRGQFDFRDIIIETDVSKNAEGSARVKIGETDVIVGVKLGVQEPYSDHEDEGTLMTGMEFSPIAGERYENGPPQMDAIEIARVVDRGVRESGFIDFKGLCIKKGDKVWSISIDIYCINDDGNALDASAIGAVTALMLSKFPEYDEKEGLIKYGKKTDKNLPLTDVIPLTMTFHKIGEKIFVDPNRDEEDSSEARLTLSLSKKGKDIMINSMQKGEIGGLTSEDLDGVIENSEKVYQSVFPLIQKQIGGLK